MKQIWQRKSVRFLTYSSWTMLIFLMSLVWTYPSDALVAEVEAVVNKSGVLKSFEATNASLSGLGVAIDGVSLVTAKGDPNLPWKFKRVWVGLKGFSFDPQNPSLRFAVDAYKGSISGEYVNRQLDLEVDALDLGGIMPLQKIVKVGLSGRANGEAAFKFAEKTSGMRGLSGRIDLAINSAGVGPGEVPIPGFGSALTMPPAKVGDLPLDLEIDKGEFELKKFKVTGGDVELAGEGSVSFVGRRSSGRMDMAFDLRPTDKLKSTQEGKNLLTALDPKSPLLPSSIKRSFSRKGWLGISITGRVNRPRIKVRKSHID